MCQIIILISRLIFCINGLVLILSANWGKGLALIGSGLLTFIPEVYTWLSKQKIPICARMWYVIFIVACQWLGTYLRFYDKFFWWDILLHFSSGFLLGYIGILFVLCLDKKGVLMMQKAYSIIAIFAFGIAVGGAICWEIVEFSSDKLLGTFTQLGSLDDTMADLIYGTLSALIFSAYTYYVLKKEKMSYVRKIIDVNKK